MARITVHCKNKFELVILAAMRAKDISSGAPITVERDNDKDPVIALREIEKKHIKIEQLREQLISKFQTQNVVLENYDQNEQGASVNEHLNHSFDDSDIFVNEHIEHINFDDNMSYEDSIILDEDNKNYGKA